MYFVFLYQMGSTGVRAYRNIYIYIYNIYVYIYMDATLKTIHLGYNVKLILDIWQTNTSRDILQNT